MQKNTSANCLRAGETVAFAQFAPGDSPVSRMDLVLTRTVATVAAFAALLGSVGLARAQSDERLEMLRGGASKKGVYNIFGLDGTGLGRTTVSYPGKYAPGTIVVDTAERRLYLI